MTTETKPTIKAITVYHQLPDAYKAWLIRCEQLKNLMGKSRTYKMANEAEELASEAEQQYKSLKAQFLHLAGKELEALKAQQDDIYQRASKEKNYITEADLLMEADKNKQPINELERQMHFTELYDFSQLKGGAHA